MTHLDEGTIHAWLDGALDDAQAREVSEHAKACPSCAALIAEARGLIAGASRILTSLDDAPAGVAPKRAPATASSRPGARRFWQASPWVTGIAAALILAVGLREWRDRPSARTAIAPVAPLQMDSLRAALPDEATPVDSALRMRAVNPPARNPIVPTAAPLRRIAAGVSGDVGGGAAGSAGALSAATGASRQTTIADQLPTAMASAPSPAKAELNLERLPVRVDERQPTVCYRVDMAAEPIDSTKAVAKGVARAADAGVAQRRLAPSQSPAAPSAVTAEFGGSAIVRLDTTNTPRGRVIVSTKTGEAIGNWFVAGRDSVRLVMPTVGARTVPSSNRVVCPPADARRP